MKHAIMAVLAATFALGLSSGVRADGLTFLEKQELSCKAIASVVSEDASKRGIAFHKTIKIYDGAKVLCEQSYNQASAEYPMAKAKKAAVGRAGEVAGVIVELAYDSYQTDNK